MSYHFVTINYFCPQTEDRELRVLLQRQRLEDVLHWQEQERRDESSPWGCLMCRAEFVGWHGQLLDHMARDHNFSVGQPHNLVFVRELMDKLEGKMAELRCVYCDRVFKTREVLKEHMRKKAHKKINPHDKSYDLFYVVNYQVTKYHSGFKKIGKCASFLSPLHRSSARPGAPSLASPSSTATTTTRGR